MSRDTQLRYREAFFERQGVFASAVRGATRVAQATYSPTASVELQEQRWLACLACDAHQRGQCMACGCWTAPKIRLTSEQCPRDAWPEIAGSS